MASGPNPVAVAFGKNLAAARKRSGYSQEQVAVRASVHRTEVGVLERGGRVPQIETVVKLAGAVNVSVADLLAGIEWTPGEVRPGGFVRGRL